MCVCVCGHFRSFIENFNKNLIIFPPIPPIFGNNENMRLEEIDRNEWFPYINSTTFHLNFQTRCPLNSKTRENEKYYKIIVFIHFYSIPFRTPKQELKVIQLRLMILMEVQARDRLLNGKRRAILSPILLWWWLVKCLWKFLIKTWKRTCK